MSDLDNGLDGIRREIDILDVQLLGLLNRRSRLALEVAAVKDRERAPRYYRPEREAALLRRLIAHNEGPLPDVEVTRLFRQIVSTCRALEQRLVIGCSTVREACAAIGHFGGAVDIRDMPNVVAMLDSVAGNRLDFATIGFSQAGVASPVVTALSERALSICGEWYAPDGERFVVIGCEPLPRTGWDWTSFVLATRRLVSVESWCRERNLRMRATPVLGRTSSSVVDVATYSSDSRLADLIDRLDATMLGVYPDVGVGIRGE